MLSSRAVKQFGEEVPTSYHEPRLEDGGAGAANDQKTVDIGLQFRKTGADVRPGAVCAEDPRLEDAGATMTLGTEGATTLVEHRWKNREAGWRRRDRGGRTTTTLVFSEVLVSAFGGHAGEQDHGVFGGSASEQDQGVF